MNNSDIAPSHRITDYSLFTSAGNITEDVGFKLWIALKNVTLSLKALGVYKQIVMFGK